MTPEVNPALGKALEAQERFDLEATAHWLEQCPPLDDPAEEVIRQVSLAHLALQQGDDRMLDLARSAHALSRRTGVSLATAAAKLAEVLLYQADIPGAWTHAREALEHSDADPASRARSHYVLAKLHNGLEAESATLQALEEARTWACSALWIRRI